MAPSSKNAQRKRYRSSRSIRRDVPTFLVTKWTKAKIILVVVGTLVLGSITLLPIILLEQTTSEPNKFHPPVSLHNLLEKSKRLEEEYKKKGASMLKTANGLHMKLPSGILKDLESLAGKESGHVRGTSKRIIRDATEMPEEVEEQGDTSKSESKQHLARGVSGLPMAQTPALLGASPGHVDCDVDVDDIVYWNDPQGTRDQEFKSPFATPPNHYLTFQPDRGGWNNIRMSMEIIFVLAATTGRTLVLPPKAPMYLLGTGADNARSFGNFYPLNHPEFQKRVDVITMSEFLKREGKGLLNLSDEEIEKFTPIAEMCLHKPKSPIDCELLYEHLRNIGFQPPLEGAKQCFVFDKDHFEDKEVSADTKERVARFCGEREEVYYEKKYHTPKLIHWNAGNKLYRLLNHFYAFTFFTDPVIDNFYKRFVRDFLHYEDSIYCAAGKIVHALNKEGKEGNGWSSLHVRRGDLQYKKVKIPAEEWYQNTKEIWKEGEILFIATDERNKTFFDPIKEHHQVRFLDDYWTMANLGSLDSNFLGMIDTIIASHGRAFAGTWFSTFTGYINRMRGYLGHPMENSWYGWLPRKDAVQVYRYPGEGPNGNYVAREWPLGWVAIDGDEIILHEGQVVTEDIAQETLEDQGKTLKVSLTNLVGDEDFIQKPLNRGVAGRPVSETPALDGASRAHLECDVNVDSLAYWNDPQGTRDQEFVSPFHAEGDEKYISFTVDRGGWNNVRMSMEIIFVIAAVTGRTLVLPPKEPLYRLSADKENKFRGFADFFPLHTSEFGKRVKTISMAEFIKREGGPNGRVSIPESMRLNVTNSADHCDKRKKSKSFCGHIADYLADVGYVPDARAQDFCVVFDKDVYEGRTLSVESEESVVNFCGNRNRTFWNPELQDKVLIHFRAGDKKWRLLAHFYGMIHFTDPAIGNYYKRFVRDFLHYNDRIYCAAGKIVKALQLEGRNNGFKTDEEGGGGYSAMHVRRGDFQYKKVKIPAEEWYENTKELWKPNEIIFIATDERNKTFFDPIAKHHKVRFLDDYSELAGLDDLDPNYFGMIDTIISSRARAFAGTWFSTFSGYINRMRGYHGMTMMDSWYSFLDRKTAMHTWDTPDGFAYAYEWPDGWIGIDADIAPDKEIF